MSKNSQSQSSEDKNKSEEEKYKDGLEEQDTIEEAIEFYKNSVNNS